MTLALALFIAGLASGLHCAGMCGGISGGFSLLQKERLWPRQLAFNGGRIASYAAATIGKTDPIKTGWEAMRLCSIAYIVPFLFVFSPSLLLIGEWYEVMASVLTAIAGAILLGVGVVGYLFRPVGAIKRALFVTAAIGLLIPIVQTGNFAPLTWLTNGIGLALALGLLAIEWLARLAHRKSGATMLAGQRKASRV